MSEFLSNVWLELKGMNQKILICAIFCKFDLLTGNGPMNSNQQIDNLKILQSQIERSSKEGLILVIGDINIDLIKLEHPTYYQNKTKD